MIKDFCNDVDAVFHLFQNPLMFVDDWELVNQKLLHMMHRVSDISFDFFNLQIPLQLSKMCISISSFVVKKDEREKSKEQMPSTALNRARQLYQAIVRKNCSLPVDTRCGLNGAQKHNFVTIYSLFINHGLHDWEGDEGVASNIDPEMPVRVMNAMVEQGIFKIDDLVNGGHLTYEEGKSIRPTPLTTETLRHIYRLANELDSEFFITQKIFGKIMQRFAKLSLEWLWSYAKAGNIAVLVGKKLHDALLLVLRSKGYGTVAQEIKSFYANGDLVEYQYLLINTILRDNLLTAIKEAMQEQKMKYETEQAPIVQIPAMTLSTNFFQGYVGDNSGNIRNYLNSLLINDRIKKLAEMTFLKTSVIVQPVYLEFPTLPSPQFQEVLRSSLNSYPCSQHVVSTEPLYARVRSCYLVAVPYVPQPFSPVPMQRGDPDQLMDQIISHINLNKVYYEFPSLVNLLSNNPHIFNGYKEVPEGKKSHPVIVYNAVNAFRLHDSLGQKVEAMASPPINLMCFTPPVWAATLTQQAGESLFRYTSKDLEYLLEAYLTGFLRIKETVIPGMHPLAHTSFDALRAHGNSLHMNLALQLIAARISGIGLALILEDRDMFSFNIFYDSILRDVNTLTNGCKDVSTVLQKLEAMQYKRNYIIEYEGGAYWRPG